MTMTETFPLNKKTKPELLEHIQMLETQLESAEAEKDRLAELIEDSGDSNAADDEYAVISVLMNYFDSPGRVWSPEARSMVKGNTLGYVQRGVLDGFLNDLVFKLEMYERNLDERQKIARDKERVANQSRDEIAIRQALFAIERVEEKATEVALVQRLFDAGTSVFKNHFGVEFKPRERKSNVGGAVKVPDGVDPMEELHRRMAAAGLKSSEAPTLQTSPGAAGEAGNTNPEMQPL